MKTNIHNMLCKNSGMINRSRDKEHSNERYLLNNYLFEYCLFTNTTSTDIIYDNFISIHDGKYNYRFFALDLNTNKLIQDSDCYNPECILELNDKWFLKYYRWTEINEN